MLPFAIMFVVGLCVDPKSISVWTQNQHSHSGIKVIPAVAACSCSPQAEHVTLKQYVWCKPAPTLPFILQWGAATQLITGNVTYLIFGEWGYHTTCFKLIDWNNMQAHYSSIVIGLLS